MIRLESQDVDLVLRIDRLDQAACRRVAVAGAELAIERAGLRDADVDMVLQLLKEGVVGDTAERASLAQRVQELDEIQWRLQDEMNEGRASEEDYNRGFSQARAASAVFFAVAEDAREAALEALYEALAATDDLGAIRVLVRTEGPTEV
jgi:hypothetical protein